MGLRARPQDIRDAITRRSNHLAHHAITTNQSWIHTAIADWHTTHRGGCVAELHKTITAIAAYRERTGHHGPDPLGPTPTEQGLRATWEQLNSGGRSQLAAPSTIAVLDR